MLQMILLGIGKVGATSVRPLDKAAWLEALAALEAEFISFRKPRRRRTQWHCIVQNGWAVSSKWYDELTTQKSQSLVESWSRNCLPRHPSDSTSLIGIDSSFEGRLIRVVADCTHDRFGRPRVDSLASLRLRHGYIILWKRRNRILRL